MTRTAAVAYHRPGPPEVLEDVEIDSLTLVRTISWSG